MVLNFLFKKIFQKIPLFKIILTIIIGIADFLTRAPPISTHPNILKNNLTSRTFENTLLTPQDDKTIIINNKYLLLEHLLFCLFHRVLTKSQLLSLNECKQYLQICVQGPSILWED